MAYNRTGQNLEDRIREQVEQTTQGAQDGIENIQQENENEANNEQKTTPPTEDTQPDQTTDDNMMQ